MTKDERQKRASYLDHIVIHEVTDTIISKRKDGVEIYAVDVHKRPLVICKDCKYWQESQYYPQVMVCTYVIGATFTRQHDDYCSRGERKDDE